MGEKKTTFWGLLLTPGVHCCPLEVPSPIGPSHGACITFQLTMAAVFTVLLITAVAFAGEC